MNSPATPTTITSGLAIESAIEHATHLLPAQGPITAFVHHNTLHAFEDLDFDAAVRKGARIFGCHPYLPEKHYREMLTTGRIRDEDIEAVQIDNLDDRADDLLGFLGTRFGLYRAILRHSLHDGPTVDLRWVMGDTNALNRFRDDTSDEIKKQLINDTRQWVMRDLRNMVENLGGGNKVSENQSQIPDELLVTFKQLFDLFGKAKIEKWSDENWESFILHLLWKTCEFGASQANGEAAIEPPSRNMRHRDWVQELTSEDPDELVDKILIPFCAAFLDQGFSNWQLFGRDQGFMSAFIALYANGHGLSEPWRRGIADELKRHRDQKISPVESIQHSLHELGVTKEELDEFVGDSLLALRGFAGMLWQLETRGDRVSRGMPEGTIVEFLAVRLILDRFATQYLIETNSKFDGSLKQFRQWAAVKLESRSTESATRRQRNAFRMFELAQLLDWRPRTLAEHCSSQWQQIVSEVNAFTRVERREIYHLAYERKYRNETLDAVQAHSARTKQLNGKNKRIEPDFQMVNCIDEREESFRRHLEEISPNFETFGAAGFFAIPMYYRGAADAHYTPLCPVVIKPDHHVREEVVYSLKRSESKRKRARRTIGTVTHRVHIGSRTLTGGWLGTAFLGSLATFPLVLRILFPRLTAQFRRLIGGFVKPPETTQLHLERDPQFPPGPDKKQLGFTVEEMAHGQALAGRHWPEEGLCQDFLRLRSWICKSEQSARSGP